MDPSTSPSSCWWLRSTEHHPACTFCLLGLYCRLCTPHSSNLAPTVAELPSPAVEDALVSWQQCHNESPPSGSDSALQKEWDAPIVTAMAEALVRAAPDGTVRARLLASQRKESGKWLQARSMSSLGLRMDDEVMRVAVGLRLEASLCRPHKCHQCGADVDHLALHGLSCRKSQGRHSRHAAMNDLLKRSLVSAKIPSILNPTGMARSNGKRWDFCYALKKWPDLSLGCHLP